jgi:hypothetical protein
MLLIDGGVSCCIGGFVSLPPPPHAVAEATTAAHRLTGHFKRRLRGKSLLMVPHLP